MESIKKYLTAIEPREYQKQIFQTCRNKNTLVILPTGLGKTLIALMLAIDRLVKFPTSKILFLAPTRPLIEQHFNYFKKQLPELFGQLELFTGKTDAEKRKELWQSADIIFSTPQCIGNDVKKRLYDLKNVSLLIEDECHRCFKNYAYTYVAEVYKEQSEFQRILGLTASPGHEEGKVKKICESLGIEAVEIRTRESEDVKNYLQELDFNTIRVEFPEEFKKIRDALKAIYDRKIYELQSRKLLFGNSKIALLEAQRKIMKMISVGNKHFNLLVGASTCAQALKVSHSLELIETQTLASLKAYMEDLFSQAKRNESKAAVNLVKQPEFNQAYTKLMELIARKVEHPKLLELKDIISNEIKDKEKAIVFCQYRDTVAKISQELNTLPNIKSKVFVGQSKKGTGKNESGLSQKEQQALVRDFSSGEVNVLVSTSIGEEGLDIPEVNLVVFYEPIPSAIRKIQRAGRTARLCKGKLIILLTEKTRDEVYHWSAFHKEKKMQKIIKDLKEELDSSEDKIKENQEKLF